MGREEYPYEKAMVSAGLRFENRVQGDYGTVREGSADTGGERLVTDTYVRPHGAVAGEHVHSYITERFEVVTGRVGFHVYGRERILGPGDRAVVPPGVPHDWFNAGDEEAHIIVDVRPAERFELMIQTLYGLANDGKTNAKGIPHLLQLALFAQEFRPEIEFLSPPRWLQRLLFTVLSPIARARGYRAIYSEYLGPTGKAAAPPPTKAERPALRSQ